MAELISILLWSIGFLWAFWGMYVLVMGIYRAHRMGWRRYRVLLARAQSDAKYPDVKLPQRPDGGAA